MKYLGYVMLIVVFLSCSKEEEQENVEPVLTFESMTPTTVTELVEEIVLKFKYTDNDGNLGENDAGATNLFVTDSRNQVVNSFRVKQLAPDNSTIAIEGTLSVTINPLLITDESTSESGTFSIYMNDRAGNKSNVITSSEFTVSK